MESKAQTRSPDYVVLIKSVTSFLGKLELIDHGGISPGDVTILSPYPFGDSCIALLPEKIRREIVTLDEYSLRNFPNTKISFAEAANFKGLENEAIIVTDLPPPT